MDIIDDISLRKGAKSLIIWKLKNLATQSLELTINNTKLGSLITDISNKCEMEILNLSRNKTTGYNNIKSTYLNLVTMVDKVLSYRQGIFPDDIVGIQLIKGDFPIGNLFNLDLKNLELDQRSTMVCMFIRMLMLADNTFRNDRNLVLITAKRIEQSCFNCVIKMCKISESSFSRSWDSKEFVDIYSTRCGSIAEHINPESDVNKTYDPKLVNKLISSIISPDRLGYLSEHDLCPDATAAEAEAINKRLIQKVIEKESNMFQCPFCHERRCTYTQVQIRGSDEAPDYFCKCLSCDQKFKGRT